MQRKELGLDEHVEAFPFPTTVAVDQTWQAAAQDAAHAYRAWCEAPLSQRGDAYAVYRAAEEREAAAAEDLCLHEEACRRA